MVDQAAAAADRDGGEVRHHVTVAGGGSAGQAGAIRHGISRALLEFNGELRERLEVGRLPDPRPAQEGTQEVRPEGRPRAVPVQQALKAQRRRGAILVEVTHEGTAGGRCPLRAPDPALEPEDEALHLRQAQRDLHHRPAEDRCRCSSRSPDFVQRLGRRGQAHPVRRHQAPGAGGDRRGGGALRRVLRHQPLAGRHADQLRHHAHLDRAPEGDRGAGSTTRTAR